MPGKVTRAHEKQEENCANCHDRSNVRTQSSLCLDCHKEIAADVRDHLGFHGRMAQLPASANAAPATRSTRAAQPISCSSMPRASTIT